MPERPLLADHPHLSAIVRSFHQYQAGSLSVDGLQTNLYSLMSVIEGDVPERMRLAVYHAEEEIELSRCTVAIERERQAVASVFALFRAAIEAGDVAGTP